MVKRGENIANLRDYDDKKWREIIKFHYNPFNLSFCKGIFEKVTSILV